MILRFLLVGGEPGQRAELRRLLLGDPVGAREIGEAATGTEGIEAARWARPDCILVDHDLPDMDVPTFLETLGQPSGELDMALVVLTEEGREELALAAMRAGALDYLDKGRLDRGRLMRSIGVAADRLALLRAQRAAALALERSEERYRLAAEALDGYIYEWNLLDGSVERSPGLEGLLGLRPGQAAPHADWWTERLHPDDRRPWATQMEAVAAGRAARYRTEVRLCHEDGRWIWVSDQGHLSRDAGGRPTRILGTVLDISARKEGEERLRRREADLARVQRLGHIGGYEVEFSEDGLRNRRFPEYLRIHGLPPQSWDESHRDWLARVHPDDRARAEADFLEALASGRTDYAIEYRIIRPSDSETRWISVQAEIERDAGGRPRHLFGAHTDVTDRKLAEERLREGEERYRLALSAVDGMVYDANLLTGEVARSDALERIAGWRPDEVPSTAQWWLDLIHPDDVAQWGGPMQEALAARRERIEAEYRIRHRDGRWVHVADRSFVLYGPEGPVRIIGSTIDITPRKAAEAALRDSERRFRAVFENAGVGVALATLDEGRCFEVNDAICAILGYPREELLRTPWTAITHPDDLGRDMAQFRELAAGRIDHYEIEKRYIRKDGQTLWARLALALVRNAEGAPDFEVAIVEDISERKAAQEALARANEALEAKVADRTRALSESAEALAAEMKRREEAQAALLQAQKLEALGQLTGGIAHDFNNVLAAVMGTYRMIARRTQDEQVIELVRHGESAAERATTLVRQLMAFARHEQLKPQLVEPQKLAPQVETLVRHAIGAGIDCAVEVEQDVWPVLADPHRLEVALLNLAVNARDAMPGGGRLRVLVRRLPGDAEGPGRIGGGDRVAFSVSDTGTGMAPEVLARAIEPFFTTKEPGRGTGLGLAMVHGFAEQSGGTLRIDSHPGEGTTVSILLPRAPARPEILPAGPSLQRSGRATLLLVDDDEQLRPVTAAALREMGYDVIEAPEAETAFALASGARPPDLVITDVVMPGADGTKLAERLRAYRPDLPVMFITGHAGGHALEGEVVLRKPFREAELSDLVQEMLARSPSWAAMADAARG